MSTLASPDLAMPQPADPVAKPPGLRNAFRLLIEHLGDHADLLRLEAGQEISRLGSALGCWFALALLIQMSLMLGIALLVAGYWNTEYRSHVIAASSLSIAALVGFCTWQLKRLGAKAAKRFDYSSQQLKRDLDLIRELI